jgi:hypothetical protein
MKIEIKQHEIAAEEVYPPEVIGVTFTEEDVENAGRYTDTGGCLLCTALKRMGFKDVAVGGLPQGNVNIDGFRHVYELADEYNCDPIIKHCNWRATKPHFDKSVVGLTLTFVRIK